jgi:hypothetical protein
VTAIAHHAETLIELDADISERLRELSGDDYERAEDDSWQALQRELLRLERRRRMLNLYAD